MFAIGDKIGDFYTPSLRNLIMDLQQHNVADEKMKDIITCVCLKIRHPEVFAIPQEKLTKHAGTEKNLEENLRK